MNEVLYVVAFLFQIGLCYSYGLAFTLKPRLHIAALFVFMIAITIRTVGVMWQLYSKVLFGEVSTLPLADGRALLLAVASGFLLYTTWRSEKIPKHG